MIPGEQITISIMTFGFAHFFTLACTLGLVVAGDGKHVRTKPDRGAIIVDASGKYPGSFLNVSAAVSSLHNRTDAQKIFIFPGTYAEQVYIAPHAGPLTVQGYTNDARSYQDNEVSEPSKAKST